MRSEIRALVLADPADKWGGASATAFAICDVLYAAGASIPAEWQYRPGLSMQDVGDVNDLAQNVHCEFSWETEELARLYVDAAITDDELRDAGKVIDRYQTLLEKAGLSY